jgi:NADPH:quinone reductase-like Zn-dependent oxidoreductase
VIATKERDLVAEVMKITDGKGARVVFDPVGGPILPKLISAMSFQDILYIYGALSDGVTPLPLLEMIARCRSSKATTSGSPAVIRFARRPLSISF